MQRKDQGKTPWRLTLLLLCAFAIPGQWLSEEAKAFKQEDVDRPSSTKQCPDCDLTNALLTKASLSGAILTNAKLNGAYLGGANLSRAFLSGANLTGADLSGANLVEAHLGYANLTGAHLDGANLEGASIPVANLSGATLNRANMVRADLEGATLAGAELKYAELSSATLKTANLNQAILTFANLSGAHLGYANLTGANLGGAKLGGATGWDSRWGQVCVINFANANLSGADLSSAFFMRANLTGANLQGAILTGTWLDEANLTQANLTGVNLTKTTLSNSRLPYVNLTGAILTGLNFSYLDLYDAKLRDALLKQANLSRANLTNADLTSADLTGADLGYTKLYGANLTSAVLESTHMEFATLSQANLSSAYLEWANLTRADLSGANLAKANLYSATLTEADLSSSDLSGANLSKANLSAARLSRANLTGAKLTGADLTNAWLTFTKWTNGWTCAEWSLGRCASPTNLPEGMVPPLLRENLSLTPELSYPEMPAEGLAFGTRHFIICEGETLVRAIASRGLSATVPEEALRYGKNYEYGVLDTAATGEFMNFAGPFLFATPPKPAGADDYGNPLIARVLKNPNGDTVPLADNKLSTLIAAAGFLPQADRLLSLQNRGGTCQGRDGRTLATANVNDVHVVRSQAGRGKEIIMAASDTNTIATIVSLTASGHGMDASGSVKASPDVTVRNPGISLPFGLLDFTIILDGTNRAEVVIVPPTPFAADTKWYKVGAGGTLSEYPYFQVDAQGNGVLTLFDTDDDDRNPAWDAIRDPGGPGVAGGGGGGCFIATAAYGSYLHPFVKTLRDFRDTILLTWSPGKSFVAWYYRVSPPIAEAIARSYVLGGAVRLALLPAIGIAWLCLNLGVAPALFMFLVFGVVLFVGARTALRRNGY